MEKDMMTDYLRIIKGYQIPSYLPPEEQGKKIKRCTLLEDANFSYSNYTQEESVPSGE